jgi:preprotein translocase subunit SecB
MKDTKKKSNNIDSGHASPKKKSTEKPSGKNTHAAPAPSKKNVSNKTNVKEPEKYPAVDIEFIGSFIKGMKINNPSGPFRLSGEPVFKTSCNVNAQNIERNIYEVEMIFQCICQDSSFQGAPSWDNGLVMDMEILYTGIFNIKTSNLDAINRALYVDCTAILMPILRGCVASITAHTGLPPILLDYVTLAQWETEFQKKYPKK